ncbi:MAG: methylenetetrahydrofolate reductase [Chloroflexota bacterium]
MNEHSDRFSRKLRHGHFAICVEMTAPAGGGSALGDKASFVRTMAERELADAVDIVDGVPGRPRMFPEHLICLLRDRLGWPQNGDGDGVEWAPHLLSRDMNAFALRNRIAGLRALGIRNVLATAGDPPEAHSVSPTPPTRVANPDTPEMIRMFANEFVESSAHRGAHLGEGPEFGVTVGATACPEAADMDLELTRLTRKVEAGASYVLTQAVFANSALAPLEGFRGKTPLLPGVMILKSARHVERVARIPGLVVPEHVRQNIARFDSPKDQEKVGVELADRLARELKESGWPGIYLMAAASPQGALTVLEELKRQ